MSLGLTIGVIAFCLFILAMFVLVGGFAKCGSMKMRSIDEEDLGADGGVDGHAYCGSAQGVADKEPSIVRNLCTARGQAGIKPGPSAPTFNPMNRFPAGRWSIPPGKLTKILK